MVNTGNERHLELAETIVDGVNDAGMGESPRDWTARSESHCVDYIFRRLWTLQPDDLVGVTDVLLERLGDGEGGSAEGVSREEAEAFRFLGKITDPDRYIGDESQALRVDYLAAKAKD